MIVTLSPRPGETISAETVAPSTNGAPTGGHFKLLELQGLAFLNAVLLTATFDNCVHDVLRTLIGVGSSSTCGEWRLFRQPSDREQDELGRGL